MWKENRYRKNRLQLNASNLNLNPVFATRSSTEHWRNTFLSPSGSMHARYMYLQLPPLVLLHSSTTILPIGFPSSQI